MPWTITFEDHVYRENDITIGQAERIEDLIGDNWARIAPLRSAKHARSILTVFHTDATGMSEVEVVAKIRQIKINDFLNMCGSEDDNVPDLFEDGNPPVADAS